MTKQEIVERLLKLAPDVKNFVSIYSYRDAFAERLAENAVVMYGSTDEDAGWGFGRAPSRFDTHTALLIDVQPIKKTDPLVEKLRTQAKKWMSDDTRAALLEAAERIEKGSSHDDK